MWEPYKKGFRSYLQLEKSLSDNTVQAYLRDIELLTQYLQANKETRSPADISLKDLQSFRKKHCRTRHDGLFAGKDHFRHQIIL
jgi:integrase/recombinase XerD